MEKFQKALSNGLHRMRAQSSLIVFVLVAIITVLALALVVKGFAGTPSATELSASSWSIGGPLELSPERGRLALLYSIVEDHSLKFSLPVARLAVPDLAMTSAGEYVSLFAPAVSFIAAPGYIIGKMLGASQVGAYAVVALFALLNFFLIRSIALRLGAEAWAALVGALTFSIATPAFAYAGTLYQHHISTTLLLLSLWILVRFRNIWSLAFVWFSCSLSVVVDNPNLFLMFPVGIYSLMRLGELILERKETKEKLIKSAIGLATFLALVPPMIFFGWYNLNAYGNVLQLPGTLQGVDEIGPDGKPVKENAYEKQTLTADQLASLRQGGSKEKSALGFFKTRNLYEGFYIHFLSPDRGIVSFTPVVLIGIIGFMLLYRRERRMTGLLIACIGANVLLYSMWGDPQGGWAFGSRYLIPTYALLAIGIAMALSKWRYSLAVLAIFLPLFVHSLWVNSLGAVTSIANPPKTEILSLEKQSGRVQKYTYERNEDFLDNQTGSKTFVYQNWAKQMVTAREYHRIVFGLGLLAILVILIAEYFPAQRIGNWIKTRRV
jgi:hypothetical protein